MTRYSFPKYAATKYGASSASTPRWGFVVDWDDDGFYDSTNEAQYMIGLRIDRGREYYISSGNNGFEPLSIGRATLTLSNKAGRFNSNNNASPLYPNVDIGRLAQVRVRYLTATYSVFTGVITDIRQNGFNNTVTITIEDGLSWLAQNISTSLYQDIQAPAAIAAILDAVKWPGVWGRDLGNGADQYAYWWVNSSEGLDELRRVVDSELGIFCTRGNGDFYYRNRWNVPSSVLSLTQALVGTDIELPQPWDFRRNYVELRANPIALESIADIWTNSGELVLAAGETRSIVATFDPAATGLIAPLVVVDYSAFDHACGTGTNLTAGVAISMTSLTGNTAALTITNSNTVTAYVYTLKIRGNALSSQPVSGSASGTGYTRRPRPLNIDLPWQHNPYNSASFAAQMVTFLNTTSPFPTVQIDNRPDIQFLPDLFDIVSVNLAAIGINSSFRLAKISHEWTAETGQSTRTTWKFEPARAYSGYWTFNSNATLNTSQLGW